MNPFRPGFQSSNINIPLHPGGTATHKSLKSLAIVTAKSEADNRVNSTVCVSHKEGDSTVYMKTTRRKNKTVWCTEIFYYRVTDKGYPANEKHYHDSNSHLKHVSVSSCPLFLSVG